MKFIFLLLIFPSLFGIAYGHTVDAVGEYRVEIGWMNEPVVSGETNGIEFYVSPLLSCPENLEPIKCAESQEFQNGIEGLKKTAGYALLPLGGGGELFSGHKGYGLGILMDLLCGPLLGSDWGKNTYTNGTANLGQLFIAINVECFMSLETFFENTERLLDELRSSKILPDQNRIFIPGEKSAEKAKQRQVEGVPVLTKVYENLQALSKEYQVELGDFPSE